MFGYVWFLFEFWLLCCFCLFVGCLVLINLNVLWGVLGFVLWPCEDMMYSFLFGMFLGVFLLLQHTIVSFFFLVFFGKMRQRP